MADAKSETQPDQAQIETLIKEVDPQTFESIPKKERAFILGKQQQKKDLAQKRSGSRRRQ